MHRCRRRRYYSLTSWTSITPLKELAFRDESGPLAANLPQDLKDKAHATRKESSCAGTAYKPQAGSRPPGRRNGAARAWSVCSATSTRKSLAPPARRRSFPFGINMCAPVLIAFGTEAQKKRFLPRIYNGEDFWCQGYSEQGQEAIASLKTKAVKEGARYRE